MDFNIEGVNIDDAEHFVNQYNAYIAYERDLVADLAQRFLEGEFEDDDIEIIGPIPNIPIADVAGIEPGVHDLHFYNPSNVPKGADAHFSFCSFCQQMTMFLPAYYRRPDGTLQHVYVCTNCGNMRLRY